MFSLRRIASCAARNPSPVAIARPFTTAFSASTFAAPNARPQNLAEFRSFEALIQRRMNSTGSFQSFGADGDQLAGRTYTDDRANPKGFTNAAHQTRDGQPLTPTKTVYVGNLQFDCKEEDLKQEFGNYGDIVGVKIIYDARGLSKGFGYVEYSNLEGASEAIDKMHNNQFFGRRVNVQYVAKQTSRVSPAPESKTLFIGNMSFEMTDRDLNELFKDIKNCVDVRVAMDRRTGQPRGFAHADFVDIESAVAAKEKLSGAEFFGRALRVDFTGQRDGGVRQGLNRREDSREGGDEGAGGLVMNGPQSER